jgi:hypothetical protein
MILAREEDFKLAMWQKEVADAEDEILLATEHTDGKSGKESIEEYAERCKRDIDIGLARLAHARKGLMELEPQEKNDADNNEDRGSENDGAELS